MRLTMELAGVLLYAAAHVPVVFFYALGSGLRDVPQALYWAAIVVGYVVMIVLALLRPGPFMKWPRRRAFDAWLLAALPALVLTTAAVWMNWPLRLEGWDGHGFGAEGGEANAALFPWLHGAFWYLFLLAGQKRP